MGHTPRHGFPPPIFLNIHIPIIILCFGPGNCSFYPQNAWQGCINALLKKNFIRGILKKRVTLGNTSLTVSHCRFLQIQLSMAKLFLCFDSMKYRTLSTILFQKNRSSTEISCVFKNDDIDAYPGMIFIISYKYISSYPDIAAVIT